MFIIHHKTFIQNESEVKYKEKYKSEMKELKLRTKLLKQLLPYDLDDYYLEGKRKYIKNKNGCILFADIVGYCEIAEKYTDIVRYLILDDIYSRFDHIIRKYPHIQKIETIGDAYMVVGDLNNLEFNPDLYLNICEFAFEIMEEIKKVKTPNHKLDLRIGIHVGSYIISVLGSINPRLSIIGKNVNKTARLQSTAEKNSIQISKWLYDILSNMDTSKQDLNFDFVKNENVYLKNIGTTTTYTMKKMENNSTK
jgi:class 3 adenylate cyclase